MGTGPVSGQNLESMTGLRTIGHETSRAAVSQASSANHADSSAKPFRVGVTAVYSRLRRPPRLLVVYEKVSGRVRKLSV